MGSRITRTAAIVIGLLLLGGLLGGACGDDDDATEFPVGVYHPVDGTEADGTMEFKSDGTWVVKDGSGVARSEGTYSVDDDLFTWETDSYCKDRFGEDGETATYRWAEDGNQLVLTEGEDYCTDRVDVIRGGFERSDG